MLYLFFLFFFLLVVFLALLTLEATPETLDPTSVTWPEPIPAWH